MDFAQATIPTILENHSLWFHTSSSKADDYEDPDGESEERTRRDSKILGRIRPHNLGGRREDDAECGQLTEPFLDTSREEHAVTNKLTQLGNVRKDV